MLNQTQLLKSIAWASYDWASAAFPIIITTFIFATYFTSHVAANPILGTYQWAHAAALSGIIVAVLSPILGAIADHGGRRKRWQMIFTAICIISAALLWFVTPTVNSVTFALVFVVIGTTSLEIAGVFYNSFLPTIAQQNYIGRLSGWAWGAGYVGGIIALSIALYGFINSPPAWLQSQTAEQVRICGPLVAVWFAIFSLPFFIFIPETPATKLTTLTAIKTGLRELAFTLKTLPQHKNLLLYLLAHLIYIDGLNTLFAFGGIYAAGTFGMSLANVVLFGITMNIAAGLGAILLAWVDDGLGSKPTILISLFFLTLFSLLLLFVRDKHIFWGLALLLGLFVGPVQAASRSLMARLAPADKTTEMFGLYTFSGRITSFAGPWLLGSATLYFGSQRAGMATILVFFITGAFIMLKVREK